MEFFTWIFFGPARLIALWEYSGVAIAASLIAMQAWLIWRARQPFDIGFFREAPVFAGLLWLIFNAFELQMSAVAAKTQSGILRLDLIVLTERTPVALRHQVFRHGMLLFERVRDHLVRLRVQTAREWCDAEPRRREAWAITKRRILERTWSTGQ